MTTPHRSSTTEYAVRHTGLEFGKLAVLTTEFGIRYNDAAAWADQMQAWQQENTSVIPGLPVDAEVVFRVVTVSRTEWATLNHRTGRRLPAPQAAPPRRRPAPRRRGRRW